MHAQTSTSAPRAHTPTTTPCSCGQSFFGIADLHESSIPKLYICYRASGNYHVGYLDDYGSPTFNLSMYYCLYCHFIVRQVHGDQIWHLLLQDLRKKKFDILLHILQTQKPICSE